MRHTAVTINAITDVIVNMYRHRKIHRLDRYARLANNGTKIVMKVNDNAAASIDVPITIDERLSEIGG